jgi:hypothetical protein
MKSVVDIKTDISVIDRKECNTFFGDALHFLNKFVLIVRHWEVCKIPYKIKGIGREICSVEIVNRLEIDHIF